VRVEVVTEMPEWLRNDLDQIFFDGKVPKRFDEVKEFEEYAAEVTE
jgi:hypothetical protein